MSLIKKKIRTSGSIISQLREDTEYEIVVDEATGVRYLPHLLETTVEEEDKPAKGKASSKPATKSKAVEDDEDEPEEKPAKKGAGKTKEPSAVEQIITDLDAGDLKEDKAVGKLVTELGADRKAVQKIVTKFLDEDITDVAAVKQLNALAGAEDEDSDSEEDSEEEDEKPVKGKTKPGAKKEVLVDPSDLEVGDEVSCYWDEDADQDLEYKEWYNGKVVKVVKGVPHIKYELDGQTVPYNEDIVTKIKRNDE
jgi:hypothetical protein